MYQVFNDEVLNGTPKYNINNNADGTKDISLANEVVNAGTPLNKATFGNLQGDIYTSCQYNTPTYSGTAMTLNLPLTSYVTGKVINITSPATFTTNPTININGLGAKTINGNLSVNQRYSLLYNGTSFDILNSNNSSESYYPTSIVQGALKTENIIPSNGWGVNTATIKCGEFELTSVNGVNGWADDAPFDGSNSSYYSSAASQTTTSLILKLPYPIAIKDFKTYVSTITTSYFSSATITGSNNNSSWTTLATISSAQTALTTVSTNNTTPYLYYKLTVNANTKTYLRVYRWEVANYYSYTLKCDMPIYELKNNMVINVIGSEYTLDKPQISINGLPLKTINTYFCSNNRYKLIYNGTSFDVVQPNKYWITQSGTYNIEPGVYYVEMCGGGAGAYSGSSSNTNGGNGAFVGAILNSSGSITCTVGAGGAGSSTGGAGGNTYIYEIGSVIAGGGARNNTAGTATLGGYFSSTIGTLSISYNNIQWGKGGIYSLPTQSRSGIGGIIVLTKL